MALQFPSMSLMSLSAIRICETLPLEPPMLNALENFPETPGEWIWLLMNWQLKIPTPETAWVSAFTILQSLIRW
jgi:hypothetical protein